MRLPSMYTYTCTCTFHSFYSHISSGRGCQVKGENLMEWNTFRLGNPLKNGDVVGCGWVREEEGAKGDVYFTVNGHRTENGFSDVPPELIPFLHIQKKVSEHVCVCVCMCACVRACVCVCVKV